MKQLFKKVSKRLLGLFLIALCLSLSNLNATPNKGIEITSSSEKANKLFQQGREAFEMGRLDYALLYMRQSLINDDKFATAWLYKYYLSNDATEKKESFKKAVRLKNEVSEGEKLMIEIAEADKNNQPNKRFELTKKLASLFPESPRALLMLAGEYQLRNETNKFRDLAYKAIKVAPESPLGYRALGASWLLNEPVDFLLAEKYLNKYLELRPDEANAHIAWGDMQRAKLNLNNALNAYTKAAEISPNSVTPLAKKGWIYSYMGKSDEAKAAFDNALALKSSSNSPMQEINCCMRAYLVPFRVNTSDIEKNPDDTVPHKKERIITMKGNSDDCHFCCSVVSMHHGFYVANHEEMSPCRCLEREFTFESQVPDKKTVEANISFVKSFLSIQSGDYDGAKKLAEKYAKTIKPEVRPGKIEAYNFLMGLICHESGDHLNAINRLKNSASDNICVKYAMGLAYDKMGNFEEAQKMLTDVASCKFANYSNTRMVKLAKNYVDAYAMRQHEFEF